jgi:hypothetical protein
VRQGGACGGPGPETRPATGNGGRARAAKGVLPNYTLVDLCRMQDPALPSWWSPFRYNSLLRPGTARCGTFANVPVNVYSHPGYHAMVSMHIYTHIHVHTGTVFRTVYPLRSPPGGGGLTHSHSHTRSLSVSPPPLSLSPHGQLSLWVEEKKKGGKVTRSFRS